MGTRKGLAPFSIPSLPNATVRFTKLNGGVLLNGPKRCDIISPGRMENCSPPISIFKSYAHLDAFEPSSLAIESHSSSTTVKLFLAKLISRVENRWNNERKRNVCFRETIREESLFFNRWEGSIREVHLENEIYVHNTRGRRVKNEMRYCCTRGA